MSFYELLRKSRLASFDPSLPQVYITYGKFKNRGEWGIKRNIPGFIRTDAITIDALDTIEHQTPYKSAQTMMKFTRRWKENFPYAKVSKPMEGKLKPINISRMSDKEFKKFLKKKVEPRKWEYREAKKSEAPMTPRELLNITYEREQSTVHGLTYSHNNPGVNVKVQGRILNRDIPSGYAVGVSGMVANVLSHKTILLNQIEREKLESFYVEKAKFDDQGKPVVKLSKSPPLYLNEVMEPLKNSLDSGVSGASDRDEQEILERIKTILQSSPSEDAGQIPTPRFQETYGELFSGGNSKENLTDIIRRGTEVKKPEVENTISSNNLKKKE
ncbi:12313_t:CDS:1 [Acaulospora colombiana]|uniref:12313_t:CDS:1 n=1 Tax=Acaulospora colombiana TaxID=27376 RepID=A0ACA9KL61_9GLOM|nr:12313_t:CDS:1 [Acaulospora colombiana]